MLALRDLVTLGSLLASFHSNLFIQNEDQKYKLIPRTLQMIRIKKKSKRFQIRSIQPFSLFNSTSVFLLNQFFDGFFTNQAEIIHLKYNVYKCQSKKLLEILRKRRQLELGQLLLEKNKNVSFYKKQKFVLTAKLHVKQR